MTQWFRRGERRILALAGLAFFVVPALAACGGDGKEEPAAETPVHEATPSPATSPLKIGLLIPYSGSLSDFGVPLENAARLAADEINGAGGVLGQDADIESVPYLAAGPPRQVGADHPPLGGGQSIELVTGDTASDPAQGVKEAARLIEERRVDVLLGAVASEVTLRVAESVSGPNGILQISPASGSPALSQSDDSDFLFRTTLSKAAQAPVLSALAREMGLTRVCNMFINNPYGQSLSDLFTRSFEASGGNITAAVGHESGKDTYESELETCAADSPEAIAALALPETASVFLREIVDRGDVDNILFVDGTRSEEMLDALGWENFDGMRGTAPTALDTPAGDTFEARYEAVYGEKPALPFMKEMYDAVYLAALAAEAAGSTDPAAMRDALRAAANPKGEVINPGAEGFRQAKEILAGGGDINYEGASGPVDLDANGDALIGAIHAFRVDAASKTFLIEAVYRVDLNTGLVLKLE